METYTLYFLLETFAQFLFTTVMEQQNINKLSRTQSQKTPLNIRVCQKENIIYTLLDTERMLFRRPEQQFTVKNIQQATIISSDFHVKHLRELLYF